jgi:tetratricopeptide (TPR) repeat protein/TolB-like protein
MSSSGNVEPQEAVASVRRVLDSETFRRSPRSRDFLAYVCAETLAGRAENLHERVVARRALHKGPDFDGRSDTSVRVQAHRVRSALRSYYAGEGAADGILVDLPTGSYVPSFTRSPHPPPLITPSASSTAVAVVRLGHSGADEDELAGLLVARTAQRLAELPDLLVVGPSHRAVADVPTIAGELGTRFVLEGSVVTSDGAPSVALTLYEGATGQLLWSGGRPSEGTSATAFDVVDDFAMTAVAHLGDYAGLMFRHAVRTVGPDPGYSTAARLAFYRHIIHGGAETLRRAQEALDAAVADDPAAPDLRAMRAFVLAAQVHYDVGDSLDPNLERAAADARLALREDPRSPLAHIALAIVAAARRDGNLARSHATRAVELAPCHPSTIFSAGGLLMRIGDWAEGAELTRRSFALNPLHPPYQHANLALERLLLGDLPGTLTEASIVDEGAFGWGPLCRAVALAGLGHPEEARREMDAAMRFFPQVLDDPAAAFGELSLSEAQSSHLSDVLEPLRQVYAAG